jgi:glycerol-3-phosphate dehydrogenase
MTTADVCVIGAGGVVGSAIMRELALHGVSVVGLEKHLAPAQETSGANSRVVHSGFHEKPGTLKARLALEGSRLLHEYAASKGVRTLRTGMLIAIPRDALGSALWRDAASLWHLWRGGRRHDVRFTWIRSPSGVRHIAPIAALAGIFIPSVFVIDVMQLITSLQRDAVEHGCRIEYGSEVRRIARTGNHYRIETTTETVSARVLVNSAGVAAPQISQWAGGPAYTVELIRGEYYELRGGIARWNIHTLIYPAVPARSRSKGIHFGPRTDGRLFIGPTAVPTADPPTAKQVFVEAARKFVPQVTAADLEYAYAGVRPKYTRNGTSDFMVRLEETGPPLVNLIGIDSPGLSACMALGRHVSRITIPLLSRG